MRFQNSVEAVRCGMKPGAGAIRFAVPAPGVLLGATPAAAHPALGSDHGFRAYLVAAIIAAGLSSGTYLLAKRNARRRGA